MQGRGKPKAKLYSKKIQHHQHSFTIRVIPTFVEAHLIIVTIGNKLAKDPILNRPWILNTSSRNGALPQNFGLFNELNRRHNIQTQQVLNHSPSKIVKGQRQSSQDHQGDTKGIQCISTIRNSSLHVSSPYSSTPKPIVLESSRSYR